MPDCNEGDQFGQPKKRRRLRSGEERKQAHLDNHEARHWREIRQGRRALLQTLLDGAPVATADDVRAIVKLPPECSPSMFGSVPGLLARAGIIESAGFAKTTRRVAHARHLQAWKLADRTKAEQWLASNPDVPDDSEAAKGAA